MILKGRAEGFSAKTIVLPAVAAVFVLQILIVGNTLYMNYLNSSRAQLTDRNLSVKDMFVSLSHVCDLVGDNACLYAATGDEYYLQQYCDLAEAKEAEWNTLHGILSGEQHDSIKAQLEHLNKLMLSKDHAETDAILLAAAEYGTDLSAYPMFADQTLSSTDEQSGLALLSQESYRTDYQELSEVFRRTQARIAVDYRYDLNEKDTALSNHRKLGWVLTGIILVILGGMCALLFVLLLIPLEKCIKRVQEGERLSDREGMLELRRLADTYNRVVSSRNALEGNLRSLSLTDALTNLPNRLAFENYVAMLRAERPEVSLTVFSLDVNGLKQINDSLGHVYGDELLRKAADCILETFSDKSGKNCFRFGGDEFAAFWVDTPPEEIEDTMVRFKRAQECRGISIAVGYAYAPRLGDTSVDNLYCEADEAMYRNKAAQKAAAKQAQENK